MMDYYEELGLDPTASANEIRQAYRHLARLLHPDHCADESGRRLAELQMKRLNAMLHVLANPAERENYDRSLFSSRTLPVGPRRRWDWPAPRWVWPSLGAILLAGLLSLAIRSPRPPVTAAPMPEIGPAPAVTKPHPKTRARERRVHEEIAKDSEEESAPPGRALATIGRTAGERSVQEPASGEPAPVRPMKPPAPISATAEAALAGSTMAGSWLFLPAPDTQSAGLYPPDYIELRVTEEAGILRGRYRARYRVEDKAISPTVAFEFGGKGSKDQVQLPWIGAGGARGEVTLRLVEHGALQVSWEASSMGAELGLISGTATLVRKLD